MNRLVALASLVALTTAPTTDAGGTDVLRQDRAPRVWTRGATPRCLGCGVEEVVYQGFTGSVFPMLRYLGRFVAVLVPTEWPDPTRLSEIEIADLVDLSDLVYLHLAELLGYEPEGEGLLTIALVPELACGVAGCGRRGRKGVELFAGEPQITFLRESIRQGLAPPIVGHELSHNFDVFSELGYTVDPVHAWTSFTDFYATWYGRAGNLYAPPDDWIFERLDMVWRPYLLDSQADWESCVVLEGCQDRGLAGRWLWGSFTNRVALLHGPQAVRGAMEFLAAYTAANTVPFVPEVRSDLHLEALAAGAGVNLACYADAWKWYVSDELRTRLESLYGDEAPFCADLDGDGFSVIEGDCDDTDGLRHPASPEIVNALDDDCNGLVDDLWLIEPLGGDFPPGVTIADLPVRVFGRGEAQDEDLFELDPGGARHLRFRVCADDLDAWKDLFYPYDPDAQTQAPVAGASRGQCRAGVLDLAPAEPGQLLLRSIRAGGYDFTIEPRPHPWPAPAWGATARPVLDPASGSLTLAVTALGTAGLAGEPTHVRFWVSGEGVVGTVPYAPRAELAWTPPPAPSPATYGYRAQLLEEGRPVSAFTPLHRFLLPPCSAEPGSACLEWAGPANP